MPPIIKKQIKKAQRDKSLSGYIKLVPLLFFVCFLVIGWLVSLAALKIFRSASSDNNFCISAVPTVLAEGEGGGESCDSCGSACGSSCMADVAACGSSTSSGDSCESCSDDSCGSASSASCCWN